MRARDIHWVAGLLEGEGSFNFSSTSPQIHMSSSDLDVVEKFAEVTGAKTINHRPNKSGNTTQHTTTLSGNRAVSWMMTIYVLMGSRRKSKIKEVLHQWRLMPGRWHDA